MLTYFISKLKQFARWITVFLLITFSTILYKYKTLGTEWMEAPSSTARLEKGGTRFLIIWTSRKVRTKKKRAIRGDNQKLHTAHFFPQLRSSLTTDGFIEEASNHSIWTVFLSVAIIESFTFMYFTCWIISSLRPSVSDLIQLKKISISSWRRKVYPVVRIAFMVYFGQKKQRKIYSFFRHW